MTREELEKRIEKKNADIEKIMRRVQKWNKGLTAEDEQAAWGTYAEIVRYCKEKNYDYEKQNQLIEYFRACRDLKDANTTLDKYKNQLTLEVAKSEATKVQAIVDFLEQWKQDVREYVAEDIHNADLYYEYNHRSCDLHNHHYALIGSGEMTEEQWKEKMAEVKKNEKHYKEITNPLTFDVWTKVIEDHINHEVLDEILDKEAEAKYWNMVEKVTTITGEINDASGLRVAHDGNLNGIIIGDKGKARLETIRTSGENAGRIVNVKRGSIAHFRLLVHEVK